MLERTAGCIENAGRRFLREPNSSIRSRTALCVGLGQYISTRSDCSRLELGPRRTLRQRHSSTTASSRTNRVSSDSRTPILEFLYPSQTQEFVATCLLRYSGGIFLRKKRRGVAGISRTFVSEACLSQPVGVHQPVDNPGVEDRQLQSDIARVRLVKLLDQGILDQSDEAWQYYVDAGHPPELKPALLAHFSNLGDDHDHRKAEYIFSSIPEELRSAEDYLHMAKSYSTVGQLGELAKVCQEGTAKGRGLPCWAFALVHSVAKADWRLAKRLWDIKPQVEEKELLGCAVPHLNSSSLLNNLLDLAVLIDSKTNANAAAPSNWDESMRDFCRFFLDMVFSTPKIIKDTPTDILLLLLQKSNSAAVLTPEHCFQLIETLQSSNKRSTFVRSIVVYRNFRWLMNEEVPPAKLLNGFLKKLASFEMTAGILHFLAEFSHFYTKPTMSAYRQALVAFSRSGDASSVKEVFERFVRHYGRPRRHTFLTPLLYVHARIGNVSETLAHFQSISDKFGLEPNEICWNILLTAYAKAGDVTGCFSQFKLMLERGIKPSSPTFGILMGLCAKRGDTETVSQLLDLAKQHQVHLATPLLDPIVEAYCNRRDLKTAESVVESFLGLDAKGSRVRMWNLLLWNYAFRLDLESISRIRSRMDAVGLQPDDMTYAALMLALVLVGQTDSARRILRTLHRSRRIHATEFHYTLILYGYVKDRNRDMVHIVFREIKERFNSPGLSSLLLVLKMQLQRDIDRIEDEGGIQDAANLRFDKAEKFLAETIAEFDPAKLATKQPVPGARKQPLNKVFPAVYYETLIREYGKRGASDRVDQLYDQYVKGKRWQKFRNINDVPPPSLLETLMLAYLKSDQLLKVEACWRLAFRRARRLASRPEDGEWLSSQLVLSDLPKPPRPSLSNSDGNHESILVNADPEDNSLALQNSPILPAYRFMLSRALSLYMRSLAYRNKPAKLRQLRRRVEEAGFSLTTSNWSTFVQMLASSDRPTDRAMAFSVFEEKFMPNFPGWDNLRRGYGHKHPDVPNAVELIEGPSRRRPSNMLGKAGRRHLTKLRPDFMQPTYVSMVYLTAALFRVREKSISDGRAELNALHAAAPKTILAIAEMPYLRDKFQGVLLRRRQERGDPKGARAGKDDFPVWTGGILGVGGRRRTPQLFEKPQDTSMDGDLPQSDSFPFTVSPSSTHTENDTPRYYEGPHLRTIEYQDEYDLEVESILSTRRRLLGTEDELVDNHELMDDFDSKFEDETEVEGATPSVLDEPALQEPGDH